MNDRLLVEVIRVEVLGAEAASSGRWDPLSKTTEGIGSGIEARVAVSGALREDAVARALWTRELHWGSLQRKDKEGWGSVAHWLAYLLLVHAAPGTIPNIPEIISEEKLSILLRLIYSAG